MRDDDLLVARDGRPTCHAGTSGNGLCRQLVELAAEAPAAAVAEDHPLEQRVRGQAVGAVEPGAGALADGPEAGDVAAPWRSVLMPPHM